MALLETTTCKEGEDRITGIGSSGGTSGRAERGLESQTADVFDAPIESPEMPPRRSRGAMETTIKVLSSFRVEGQCFSQSQTSLVLEVYSTTLVPISTEAVSSVPFFALFFIQIMNWNCRGVRRRPVYDYLHNLFLKFSPYLA